MTKHAVRGVVSHVHAVCFDTVPSGPDFDTVSMLVQSDEHAWSSEENVP